jgi:tetratricopeptide (TPR) repeat protein
MTDWLQLLAMTFYAPLRGMREVRDRGRLGPAVLTAYIVQVAYAFLIELLAGNQALLKPSPSMLGGLLFRGVAPILTIAILIVPIITLIANLFDRRGSFGVVLQQEYGSLASVCLYVFSGVCLVTLVCAAFLHFTGFQAWHVTHTIQSQDTEQARAMFQRLPLTPEQVELFRAQMRNPVYVAYSLFATIRLGLLIVGFVSAVRIIFRVTILRAIAILALAGIVSLPLANFLYPLFGHIVGSPFLLIFVFLLLRGYFTEVVSTQRARAAFKQNLEAATINPRDSSAHYNLGLIHQQRGELSEARERFQRAIEIDPDELDAHYQLGRIARAQGRLAEAIGHFEEVVVRDQSHAQNEIWREIGSTYIAAGQYADGREALEKFLARRDNDPEGLYLMGRAHAGLGDTQEAASSMQACIEAVKTAPAYKYRSEKRWLHEAQQFLKGKRQEAVSSRH